MSSSWYYVEGTQRVGPVDEAYIRDLITSGKLTSDSYVWQKGFENWEHIKNIASFDDTREVEMPPTIDDIPQVGSSNIHHFDWEGVDPCAQIFTIKIGFDRGEGEVEYGPFSQEQLKKAYSENRINDKTYIFAFGMEDWKLLADIPMYQAITGNVNAALGSDERRESARKPFVASLFFHDNSKVFDGVCRDISVGGLQLLIAGFPGKIGDKVTLNVHPDNTEYHFVASGVIVRLLDGNQGFSLRFSDLNNEARAKIAKYVEVS